MGGSTLFRKSSLDSISSPEQLNDYIKVSNPSIWLVLAALFLLLTSVIVWSFAGSLPTAVRTEGMVSGNRVLCYVGTEYGKQLSVGQKASLQTSDGQKFTGRVSAVGAIPLSAAEITQRLDSGYLARNFAQGEFAVEIVLTPDQAGLAGGSLMEASIVTDDVRPVDFLLK